MADLPATRFARNFESRGEHELKGVPDTWRLFAATG
jgi:hypothetical protein